MTARPVPDDEPSLFDLPLVPPEDAPTPPRRPRRPAAEPPPEAREAEGSGELPLFGDEEREVEGGPEAAAVEGGEVAGGRAAEASAGPETVPAAAAAPARPAAVPAGFASRVFAGLADLAFVGTALVLGGVGAALLGVWPGAGSLAPLAAFGLVFSFVYSVVPLAFWGRTPGMAVAGLVARDADGGPLTFGQTGLRWLGGLLTLAAAGLPLLLALGPLGGRSAADRLSGSRTWAGRP